MDTAFSSKVSFSEVNMDPTFVRGLLDLIFSHYTGTHLKLANTELGSDVTFPLERLQY